VATAASYLISQLSVAAVDTFGPDDRMGLDSIHDVRRDVIEGFRFLLADVPMRVMSSLSCVFNFFGFVAAAALIPFFKHDLGATDLSVGYAFGVGAVGSVVGSYVAGRMPSTVSFGRVLTIAYLLDGALFVPVMLTHSLPIAVTFLALTNACVMFEIAQIVGWRTRVTPDGLVGRVFGAARLVALSGTVPGAILGGVLADRFGARLPIAVAGWGYLVMAVAITCIPAIRNERR